MTIAAAPVPTLQLARRAMLARLAERGVWPRPPTEALANDEQAVFFDSQAGEILYSGWMGAGKSRILCEKAWSLAVRYPGCRIGIFRKVQATLHATTMATFFEEVAEPTLIGARNRSDNWVELTNGSLVYFRGLDEKPATGIASGVGSLNLTFAFVDEAVELTEDDWILLLGRLRMWRDEWPGHRWHQIAAATNPSSPTHWIKKWFTPSTPDRVFLTASENRFLPRKYHEMLANLPKTAMGDRLGRGLWVAAEGTIWLVPSDQIIDVAPQPWKKVVAGIDWGYQHAFACEVIGQSGAGRLAVLDELYERGRTLDELIPVLKSLRDQHGIRTFYGDPSEPAYIEQCQRAGLPVIAATNDVLPGITAVSEEITRGMQIDPRCEGLLAEIPAYVWAPDRKAKSPTSDKPTKVRDDACDALRYGVMGLRTGAPVTQSDSIPSSKPPVVRKGGLTLVGAKYRDKEPASARR